MHAVCDGVNESLIGTLSQVSGLKVMARSTVFGFKGKDGDPQSVLHLPDQPFAGGEMHRKFHGNAAHDQRQSDPTCAE